MISSFISSQWQRYCQKRYAFMCLLALAFVIHVGFVFCQTFVADDFLQFFILSGDPQLQGLGFAGDNIAGSFKFSLFNQFNFFDASNPNFQALKSYGVLPWWVKEDASLHLWRPLTTLTHWLDYQLWPHSVQLMHVTSLVILLLVYVLCGFLYRQLEANRGVCLLAFLLLIVDVSMIYPLSWLAARNVLLVMLFGVLSLIFLHLSRFRVFFFPMSICAYISALLSAEAGITIAGYIGAYLLFYDKRPLVKRLALLCVFIAVTFLWKALYQYLGFGSASVGNYVDPVQNPLQLLIHIINFYPLLILNSLVGIDGVVGNVITTFIGWTLLVFFICWVYKVRSRRLNFWLAAMCFSLLPYLALYTSAPRFSVVSHIAVAMILAQLVYVDKSRFSRYRVIQMLSRFFIILLLFLHIFVSALGLIAANILSANTNIFNSDKADKKYNDLSTFDVAGKHVIILNSVDPFRMMFYPYRAAYFQLPLAASVRQIVPAANSLELKRLNATTLNVTLEHGLFLFGGDVESRLQNQSSSINNRQFEFYGFFHDGKSPEIQKNFYKFTEMSIKVLDNADYQRITQLQLQLTWAADDSRYVWLFWDWRKQQYSELVLPEENKSIFILGQIQ